jgi:spore coat protein A
VYDRRQFLRNGAIGAGAIFLPLSGGFQRVFGLAPNGILDPVSIPQYVTPLVIPPAMPRTGFTPDGIAYYEIAVQQFRQNILPDSMKKPTMVWSYGSTTDTRSFNYPAYTIEARAGQPVRVKWMNKLVDDKGNYLQHLLPVDPTLHWANPGGPIDTRPTFASTPGRYTGPVPLITHLHGGHTGPGSDGYPEAWYLPDAKNIPNTFSRKGMRYDSPYGNPNDYAKGFSVFQYPNDQRAATLWYHDHALGMTRMNIYAGPAGFYNIRGGPSDLPAGVLPGPAPQIGDKPGTNYYEIPIVIQDRSFNADGSLFYPDSRAFFGDAALTDPFIPNSEMSPIWNPEFFGNTMVANGKTWPVLKVEARRYRFRFLNACQSRTVILKMAAGNLAPRPATSMLPFWLIGTDGGFLKAPVQQTQLLIGTAQRNDVIVDFSSMKPGTVIYLINEGPDVPFNGDLSAPADPATTGQVMKFVVTAATGRDASTPADRLTLPGLVGLGPQTTTRKVALFEMQDLSGRPVEARLGTVKDGKLKWMDPISETPSLGATELWEIYNTTVDAHPIHLHQVQFQVVNRQGFDVPKYEATGVFTPVGSTMPLPESEKGFNDTVITYPGLVTRIKAKFDVPGLHVWHCHILEHEDNEMMRPMLTTLNPSVNLGAARGYALLALKDAKLSMNDTSASIDGDVGMGPYGLQSFQKGLITGTFFVDPTASNDTRNSVVVRGGTVPRDLSQANADALKGSLAAAALRPTMTAFDVIDKTKTISADRRGLNIVVVDDILLNKETLTLSGQVDDEFIVNVTGRLKMSGGSAIRLTGGLLPSRVLFNVSKPGDDVTLAGGSKIAGSVLVACNRLILSDGSSITGQVISGGDVTLSGASQIQLVA